MKIYLGGSIYKDDIFPSFSVHATAKRQHVDLKSVMSSLSTPLTLIAAVKEIEDVAITTADKKLGRKYNSNNT